MTEMTTGKMLFVLAIVLGCFAVLWPKIFYPMMFEASNKSSKSDALPRPGPEFNHPAFRNGKGRPIFPGDDGESIRRTIERDLKPGPIPGMRPSMGGPGIQPQTQKGQGPMGILMPLYTVGIVCFFVYTIMKIIFKKQEDSDLLENQPNMADQYSTLAEKYFKSPDPYAKGSDTLKNIAESPECVAEEPKIDIPVDFNFGIVHEDTEQIQDSIKPSKIDGNSSENVAPGDVVESEFTHKLSQDLHEKVEFDIDNKDLPIKIKKVDSFKEEKAGSEILDELIEKLKNSDDNLRHLLIYINKTDPDFISTLEEKTFLPNISYQTNAHVNGLSNGKNESTHKVNPADSNEQESSQVEEVTKPQSATASAASTVVAKKSNKLHFLFRDRIKGMFKKSKKLQTKNEKS